MGLVVLTGGARSGKSALAQELARRRALDGAQIVVAVFADPDGDDETALRVERHRHDRPAEFAVIEANDSSTWLDAVGDGDVLLVDCLGTLVTRVMDELMQEIEGLADPELPSNLVNEVEERVESLVDNIVSRRGDTIVVTNEVGSGVVPAFASGRLFRDVLGRANRRLVERADAAYLVACGRAIDISSALRTIPWPED